MDFTAILTMSLVVFGLVGFYAIGLVLNKKTPLPEGYDSPSLKCASCSSSSCTYAGDNIETLKQEIKDSLKKDNCGEGVIDE
jgi:hypothetical protein